MSMALFLSLTRAKLINEQKIILLVGALWIGDRTKENLTGKMIMS